MWIARAALVLLLGCSTAQSEHDLDVWSGLACDTAQQVERFIDIYQGDADAALAEINAEAGEAVCVIATFAFVLGPQVGIVKNARGTFRIVQILVFGFFTDEGYEASVPLPFFTIGELDDDQFHLTPSQGATANTTPITNGMPPKAIKRLPHEL